MENALKRKGNFEIKTAVCLGNTHCNMNRKCITDFKWKMVLVTYTSPTTRVFYEVTKLITR